MDINPTRYTFSCICIYLSTSISSMAGLGGGGVNVPVLLNVAGFVYKQSVILSLCAVLGTHIAQGSINIFKSNPGLQTRPLISWDLVLILLPAQLGGTNFGVLFVNLFPTTMLLCLALLVVIFAIYKTYLKGLDTYNKESNIIALHSSQINYDMKTPLNETGVYSDKSRKGYNDTENNANYLDIKDLFSNMPKPNKLILFVLAAVWIVYACIYVSLQVAVKKCSSTYFIVLATTYIPLVITIIWAVRYVAHTQRSGENEILPGDIDFSTVSYMPSFLSFFIGILCSWLGIGTAELSGPLLLNLKVIPLVSSATTSAMSLLYTSSTILHYGIQGDVNYSYAVISLCIGICGGATGRLMALWVASKYRRPSFIIFMLLFILCISVALLIYDIASEAKDFKFHDFC